jgi:hypothetical protein
LKRLAACSQVSKENARFLARMQNTSLSHVGDGKAALERVAHIDLHKDRLAVRLKSADDEETPDAADKHWAAYHKHWAAYHWR